VEGEHAPRTLQRLNNAMLAAVQECQAFRPRGGQFGRSAGRATDYTSTNGVEVAYLAADDPLVMAGGAWSHGRAVGQSTSLREEATAGEAVSTPDGSPTSRQLATQISGHDATFAALVPERCLREIDDQLLVLLDPKRLPDIGAAQCPPQEVNARQVTCDRHGSKPLQR
jgi:hypothetical protein